MDLEYEQIVSVGECAYQTYSLADLNDAYNEAFQSRDWYSCDIITAEQWYRCENLRQPISRDLFVRRELKKLDKRP